MADQTTLKNPFEGWTTLREAAKLLGRDRTTLYYWVRKGFIQSYDVAPKVRLVNIAEIKAFAATHKPYTKKS